MSTVNLATKPAKPVSGLDREYTLKNTIDFSANNVASGDVVQALSIPAHTLVRGVYWRTLTAEGATCAASIGDGADPDGFAAGINLNTDTTEGFSSLALAEGTPNTVAGYTAGKLYPAADTIDLVMGNAATAAKIMIKAVCVDFS